MKIEKRYLDGTYLLTNPNCDREDSAKKANLVTDILKSHDISPKTIYEIGCVAGDILR